MDLPVDIVTVQGTVLAPQELLAAVGLVPVLDGEVVTLTRGPVTAKMRLGSVIAEVEGSPWILATSPMLVAGRLFIPADVLPYFGVNIGVEGKFVLTQSYAPSEAEVAAVTAGPASPAKLAERTLSTIIRGNTGAFGQAKIVALTPELLRDPDMPISWGTRVRLQSLSEARSLLLVTLHNTSLRPLTMDATKLLVTDDQGRQYDYLKTEVAVDGLVSSVLAPGAVRTSVLVYDLATAPLTFYYELNGDTLGKVSGR